ncbi:hypothetical protein T06_9836 [Trichinella sp. T6]|nr:hypothetical protein T06_9836 [Trichinella sp. T6]
MKISNPIELTLTASFYIYKSTVAALSLGVAARNGRTLANRVDVRICISVLREKLIFVGSSKNNKSVDPLTNGRSPSLISLMIRKLSPPFSPVNIVSNNPRQPDNRQLCEPSVVGVRSINSTYGLSRTVCNSAAASDIESPNCRVICKRKCQQDFPLLIIFTFAHF